MHTIIYRICPIFIQIRTYVSSSCFLRDYYSLNKKDTTFCNSPLVASSEENRIHWDTSGGLPNKLYQCGPNSVNGENFITVEFSWSKRKMLLQPTCICCDGTSFPQLGHTSGRIGQSISLCFFSTSTCMYCPHCVHWTSRYSHDSTWVYKYH